MSTGQVHAAWGGSVKEFPGADCWGDPDTSFSFGQCCLAWHPGAIGAGDPKCWEPEGAGFTFERCCLPTYGRPRNLFACDQAYGIKIVWLTGVPGQSSLVQMSNIVT